ncbi:hypothetical protein [Amycolatopsis circi]|uniref:hypothetical protein n=1 Tax=Amycolatopsis circi TaxID=871959 RepID=UPI000E21C424|nr:hypothetical protein [Amycolatopsis circi]
MGNQLRTFVHVADEHGEMHAFGPDDKLPSWVRSAVTNPKAWAEPSDSPEETDPGTSGESGGEGDLVEPPRSGKGSGVEAWREYAVALGWFEEIPEDASRDDIVQSIDDERKRRAEQGKE